LVRWKIFLKSIDGIDATGKWFYRHGATVIPIVYAGNREQEFVDRINGFTSMKKYTAIVAEY
jgi:hypothetical protein